MGSPVALIPTKSPSAQIQGDRWTPLTTTDSEGMHPRWKSQ